MRRKMDEAERKLNALKRDRYALTGKSESLDEQIRKYLERNSNLERTEEVVDYTTAEDDNMADETFLSDSKHVE